MRTVVLAQLRTHAARLVAATLAIVIAVAFVVATLVLDRTARSTVLQAAGAEELGAAVVVTRPDGSLLDAAALRAVPGVAAAAPDYETSVQAVLPGRTGSSRLSVSSVADDEALQWQQVVAGTLPRGPGELAVDRGLGVPVGTRLPVTTPDGVVAPAVVTGVVDLGADVTAGVVDRAFSTAEQAVSWGAGNPVEVRFAARPGVSDTALAAAVGDAVSPAVGSGEAAVTVTTGAAAAQARADDLLGGATGLTVVLLVFAAVSVVVAGLVIANTFGVLLAQRTRELALLRCVGATANQVRRSVLVEAVVTGLVASALGAATGVGLAAGLSALSGPLGSPVPLAGLSVPPSALAVGVALGTVVTVVAAFLPARAATRLSPLVRCARRTRPRWPRPGACSACWWGSACCSRGPGCCWWAPGAAS